ncbi:MAG: co-chaperone GroES [Chlamydiales bacterium]
MTTSVKEVLGNRVLVRRAKAVTSKGGIILPDTAQEKPKEGTVVKVGPGKYNDQGELESMSVKEGDRVLFSSYSGTKISDINENDDEEYLILSEDDILGIIG